MRSVMFLSPTSLGTNASHVNNLFLAGASTLARYQETIKVDDQLTQAQRLSARWNRDVQLSISPNLWGNQMSPSGSSAHTTGFTAALDYINMISPTTVLDLRWGVARLGTFDDEGTRTWSESQFGFQSPIGLGVEPVFQAVGYSAIGGNYWSVMRLGDTVNHVAASLTKVKGIHQIKFGGEGRFMTTNHAQPGLPFSQFYFDSNTTMANPFVVNGQQGNAVASMLLGWGNQTGGPYYQGLRNEKGGAFAYQSFGAYAEDTMQLTPA